MSKRLLNIHMYRSKSKSEIAVGQQFCWLKASIKTKSRQDMCEKNEINEPNRFWDISFLICRMNGEKKIGPNSGPLELFSKFWLRIFIVLWRTISVPKIKSIRLIGSKIFKLFLCGMDWENWPTWQPFWIFSNFLISMFMKGYMRAKKEVMNKIYIERGRTYEIHNNKPDI